MVIAAASAPGDRWSASDLAHATAAIDSHQEWLALAPVSDGEGWLRH
jgi:hypothetical protein